MSKFGKQIQVNKSVLSLSFCGRCSQHVFGSGGPVSHREHNSFVLSANTKLPQNRQVTQMWSQVFAWRDNFQDQIFHIAGILPNCANVFGLHVSSARFSQSGINEHWKLAINSATTSTVMTKTRHTTPSRPVCISVYIFTEFCKTQGKEK